MTDISERLATAQRRYKDALETLKAAEQAYHAELIAEHPIKVGDILRAEHGEEAKVIGLRVEYGVVKVRAVPRRRDGTWGEREVPMWRTVWGHAKVVAHEEP